MEERILEMVWDCPTKMYQAIKRYFIQNKDIEDHKKHIAVSKDGELGELVKNIFLTSFRWDINHLTYSTQTFENLGMQLLREDNGKESAIFNKPWRIDLEPMDDWIIKAFNGTPNLRFDSLELDGPEEVAKAYFWLGYDRLWQGIKYQHKRDYPSRNLPGKNIEDCRLSLRDLTNISYLLKERGLSIGMTQSFDGKSPLNVKTIFKKYLKKPVVFEDSPRNYKAFWSEWLFDPYSLVSIEGEPDKVREGIKRLFLICDNQTGGLGSLGKENAIDLGLDCDVSPQHLSYQQRKL